jgi:hypothetical protein
MAGFGEEPAAVLRASLRECEGIAALLGQPIGAEPTEQHIVGARILGVQLEPVALEPLHLQLTAFYRFDLLRRYWKAKYRQATVLLPKLADTPLDTKACLRKTALARLSTCASMWCDCQHCGKRNQ